MVAKITKTVLIVEDETSISFIVKERFLDCNKRPDCPYQFEVEEARTTPDFVRMVRAKHYDVVVLDVRLEEKTSGLVASFRLYQQLGWEKPIRIFLTGYPTYPDCVTAMRHGAWDYIVKEDEDDIPMAQVVVNSAMTRLRQLDLRREQAKTISGDWLPRNLRELQSQFGGKIIAVWHRPQVDIIASGSDAFELEDQLKDWRDEHEPWEQPFIVEIPPEDKPGEAEG
jgi:DNA-binding NtrC family response regulator